MGTSAAEAFSSPRSATEQTRDGLHRKTEGAAQARNRETKPLPRVCQPTIPLIQPTIPLMSIRYNCRPLPA